MPLTWSDKRKLYYAILIVLVMAAVGGVLAIPYITKPATCFDGKQNQGESGVDCSGPCQVICPAEIRPPVLLWSRVFPVERGFWNAVAFVENENANLGVEETLYIFRLYDANNIIITERKGRTYVGPNERFAIFEPRINVGSRIPTRVFFEFLSFSDWKRLGDIPKPTLFVRDQKLTDNAQNTRLDVRLENGTIVPVRDIEAVAILYDRSGNALAVSSTLVETLPKESSRALVFTWPKILSSDIARSEVLTRVNLFEFTF